MLPVLPLLLSFQHLAVGVDLHVQHEFDVQQTLVLLELGLHLLPHVGHLLLLLGEPLLAELPLAV